MKPKPRRQHLQLSTPANSLLELIGEIEYIPLLLLLVVFLPGNFEYICPSIPKNEKSDKIYVQ